jgi:hypothetical protein
LLGYPRGLCERCDHVLERLALVAPLVELEGRVDARQAELERHRVQLADERQDVGRLALQMRSWAARRRWITAMCLDALGSLRPRPITVRSAVAMPPASVPHRSSR